VGLQSRGNFSPEKVLWDKFHMEHEIEYQFFGFRNDLAEFGTQNFFSKIIDPLTTKSIQSI